MTKEAFAEQAIALTDTLYRVSYSLLHNQADQQDAVQESLRRGLQKYESVRDPAAVKGWLVRILVNVCRDMLRKRGREIITDAPPEIIAPPDSDGEAVEALARMHEKFRLPLVLYHIEGYSTKEIAGILKIPEGTVKTRLARGRQNLKAMLEEGGLGYESAR